MVELGTQRVIEFVDERRLEECLTLFESPRSSESNEIDKYIRSRYLQVHIYIKSKKQLINMHRFRNQCVLSV